MEGVIASLLKANVLRIDSLFLALFLYALFMMRKDYREHHQELKQLTKDAFEIIKKNTESNIRLVEMINNLREEFMRFKDK